MTNSKALLWLGVIQVMGYVTALVAIATDIGRPDPWPLVCLFGLLLGQCALAAAFAVFGPFRFAPRMLFSAWIVVGGALVLMVCGEPRMRFRAEALFMFSLFALLMWAANQLPLWICRVLLRARVQTADSAIAQTSRNQYGIRQLMGLTLFVSLVLGLGRIFLPQAFAEELKRIKVADWIIFCSLAAAIGLMLSTTVITTLNTKYFRPGLAVSAVTAALLSYGVYTSFAMLSRGPPKEHHLFGVMVFCTYVWLQLSLLLIRAAGYRIVVG